jgi:hypothetical protein
MQCVHAGQIQLDESVGDVGQKPIGNLLLKPWYLVIRIVKMHGYLSVNRACPMRIFAWRVFSENISGSETIIAF